MPATTAAPRAPRKTVSSAGRLVLLPRVQTARRVWELSDFATTSASPEPPDVDGQHFWTRAEYYRLYDAGVLGEARIELLEGVIYHKIPKYEPHNFSVAQIAAMLRHIFGDEFVRQESPVAVDDQNDPEPDVSVTTKPRAEFVHTGAPTPSDVALVVEVADTSLPRDLGKKARIYARAGIAECWVVDLNGRRLVVHRSPSATGYASVLTLADTESTNLLAVPEQTLTVAEMLP